MANALTKLTARIERGAADRIVVTSVLNLAERFISIEDRCREVQEKHLQALNYANYEAARSFIDELESLNAQSDDFLREINTLAAKPHTGISALETPDTGHTATVSEPAAAETG